MIFSDNNAKHPITLFKLIVFLIFLTLPPMAFSEVSHGYHYAPDVGDLLGDKASFDLISPFGTGVIAFQNTSKHDVKIKISQTQQEVIGHESFGMQPHAKICIKYDGAVSFGVSGEGYIRITRDSTVASDIPKSCKNYFGLTGEPDRATEALEVLQGIIDIVGDE
ncbi:hypothetical protein [Marinicella sp. W31]|uniref:hypothetical protein n=1 Tax=Marinicella sp. W31 TaxID=3023713 RepID=UPI003756BF99